MLWASFAFAFGDESVAPVQAGLLLGIGLLLMVLAMAVMVVGVFALPSRIRVGLAWKERR